MSKYLLDTVKLSGISEMYDLANKMGGDLVRFETGGVDFPTPEHIIKSANASMLEGGTNYAPYKGHDSLRSAISIKLARKNNIHKRLDDIMVTMGASEALFLVFQAILQNGDEVILADPSWPHFSEMIKLARGVPVGVPFISADGQEFDASLLEDRITPQTRAILINSPHNPTGNVLSDNDIRQVSEIARRKGMLVISDEVYEDLVYDTNKHLSIGATYENVISLFSFSKTYAMCGWRLGYIAADSKLIDAMTKLHIYSVTCLPSFIQMAGQTALEGDQSGVSKMAKQYEQRRDCLVAGLNSIPHIKCPVPKGALYAWPDISHYGKSKDVAKMLVEKSRCVTVPGSAFGSKGEGKLRLSLSLSTDRINEGTTRIKEALCKLDV
jgi:aspartate/methionine/tyrosine aminotransferase